MRTQLTQATIEFLYRASKELDRQQLLNWHLHRLAFYKKDILYNLSVEEVREIILELEEIASRNDVCELSDSPLKETIVPRFPIYSEIVEIVPIYREAISLEVHKSIVGAAQIPRLLCLLNIPKHHERMDIENHSFGYHFHYGKIKSDHLIRTNLLFTFDPKAKTPKKPLENKIPLYVEYHAEGKTKHIDVEKIGKNKRYPIYLVCLETGEKHGLDNFKPPASKSNVFFHYSTIG